MVSTVYVAALEPDTGKSVIALAMMEVLAGRTDRVGFFRPIVGDGPDPLVELMRERYGVRAEPQGVTYAQAQQLSQDELVSTVVERFRALARDCDAVLCVGSDFTDVSAATEFALNRRLAGNLGAGVLAVVSGRGKTAAEVVAAIRFARAELADAAVVGVVANRVDPALVEEVRAAADAYVVPYDPVLTEAAAKLPGSAVAGQATVFVFPDLSSGNNTYKAVQRSAGAVAVGPVLQGLRRPVNDLSRGCTVADIVNTVAITAIQSVQRSS